MSLSVWPNNNRIIIVILIIINRPDIRDILYFVIYILIATQYIYIYVE